MIHTRVATLGGVLVWGLWWEQQTYEWDPGVCGWSNRHMNMGPCAITFSNRHILPRPNAKLFFAVNPKLLAKKVANSKDMSYL